MDTLLVLDSSPCVSAYRSRDSSGWDPCGATFPTCAPVDEGPCHFHENIIGQSCKEQYDWLQSTLKTIPEDDWLIVVAHHPAEVLHQSRCTSAGALSSECLGPPECGLGPTSCQRQGHDVVPLLGKEHLVVSPAVVRNR